ncbi:DUF4349 domain-containing protein [Kitasatospora sp. NPDC049285]|uniref:DUF4349 domain-containing protein n=1 Tax=Kitasatospora sp. NPDC049285 TaxID=3157096 RepID=UPI0034273BDB
MNRAAAAAAVAAVLLVGGCSASSDSSSAMSDKRSLAGPAAAGDAAKPAAAATPGGGTAASAAPGAVAPTNRQIAYRAQLTVRVDAVDPARRKAVDLVTQAGGFVAADNLRGGSGDAQQAALTLKVPSEAYQRTLDALGGLGKQLDLDSQAEDLTQQVADVDSRVKSMRASVDRVRALMADAKSLAEVVSLEGELTRREADLESLLRQQQELSARTSMSTVTLTLVTEYHPAEPQSAPERGFWGSVGHALGGGWHALVSVVRALLMAVAALLPFLLVLVPLGWVLWRRLRRNSTGRPRPTPAEWTGETAEAEDATETDEAAEQRQD